MVSKVKFSTVRSILSVCTSEPFKYQNLSRVISCTQSRPQVFDPVFVRPEVTFADGAPFGRDSEQVGETETD